MAIEELTQPLDYLESHEKEVNNEEIVAWFQKTRTACSNILGANNIIFELKQALVENRYGEKTPYYCILLAYAYHHIGDTDTAVIFSDMSASYFNSRDMNRHQSMSRWFSGILLCKQGELDKAKIETDRAINILAKLGELDEQLVHYESTYKKQMDAIKKSCASATTKTTDAGNSLFDDEIIVPSDAFSGIIDRIKIDKDDFLDGLWREIRRLNPSDTAQVDKYFYRLDSMLKEKKGNHRKNEKRIVSNPYLSIFLAHCYNLHSYKEESQYPLALQLAWNAIKEFQSPSSSFSHKLNKHNHALSRWYLGLLYRSNGDISSYRIQLEKTKLLFVELQQLYDETEVNEIQIIQDCLDMPELSRTWPQSLLNRAEISTPSPNQKSPYHWLGLEHASKTPKHNRRASDSPLHVFLCHSSNDKPAVRELYNALKLHDWIDPWLDKKKILPGQNWEMVIEEAVEKSDIVIICLSNHSINKEGFVQYEIQHAYKLALQKPDGVIYLIPLRLEECEVPRKMRTYQWVDYFGAEKEEEYLNLIESLKSKKKLS